MRKIYVCHQFMVKSHFKALYDCAHLYGYQIADYIVLGRKNIQKDFENEWHKRKYFSAVRGIVSAELKLVKLRFLRNELIIVGIAPYDDLMLRYSKVFGKNKSIYFTSWQYWDGNKFHKGELENKEEFEKTITRNFKGIACVSKKSSEGVAKFGLPVEIVNHAIESDRYKVKNQYKREGKYIFLGELNKRKNIDLILKYMKDHPQDQIAIDFVGDGVMKENLVRAAKYDSRIRYLGRWEKTQIEQKLHCYDFLMLPSHKEPFGIVLLEALTCGVPCIVSNALGPKEIIANGKNGFVFDREDETGFEKVMKVSMEMDDEHYHEMCRNAVKDSAKYSSKAIIKKWMALIKKVN